MLQLPPLPAWLVPAASRLRPFIFVAPCDLLAPLCDHLCPFVFIHTQRATAAHAGSGVGRWSTPENYASQPALPIAYEWTFNLKKENLKSSLALSYIGVRAQPPSQTAPANQKYIFANFLVDGWNLKKMVSICQSVPNFCLIHSNANRI